MGFLQPKLRMLKLRLLKSCLPNKSFQLCPECCVNVLRSLRDCRYVAGRHVPQAGRGIEQWQESYPAQMLRLQCAEILENEGTWGYCMCVSVLCEPWSHELFCRDLPMVESLLVT